MTTHVVAPASRNRLQLLFIFLIPFGGMGLAAWMYYSGQFIPDDRSHQGDLIWPPAAVAGFQWQTAEGYPFTAEQMDDQWVLAIVSDLPCESECRETLYRTRQAHIALGRKAERLTRAVVLPGTADGEMTTFLQREHPNTRALTGTLPVMNNKASDRVRVYLIDPLGNVMLWYNRQHSGKQILKDMEKLLKASRIG